MKKTKKTIRLNRETLRTLTGPGLRHAAGGVAPGGGPDPTYGTLNCDSKPEFGTCRNCNSEIGSCGPTQCAACTNGCPIITI